MHARGPYLQIFINPVTIHPYQSVFTITDSTRGWPLLGLLTLPTAEEREQVGRENKYKQCELSMHSCVYSKQPKIL